MCSAKPQSIPWVELKSLFSRLSDHAQQLWAAQHLLGSLRAGRELGPCPDLKIKEFWCFSTPEAQGEMLGQLLLLPVWDWMSSRSHCWKSVQLSLAFITGIVAMKSVQLLQRSGKEGLHLCINFQVIKEQLKSGAGEVGEGVEVWI